MRKLLLGVCVAVGVAAPAFAERVIVKCPASCDAVAAAIQKDGGTVVHRFTYIPAVVADVPGIQLPATRAVAGAGAVYKDQMVTAVAAPKEMGGATLGAIDTATAVRAVDASEFGSPDASPAGYLINNALTHVQPLLAAGYTGAGMKVAVIDTGIRPGFPHLTLDGSVIGGEDHVGDGNGYSNSANNGHGTFVAGMISANVVFNFNPASTFFKGIKAECPACVVGATQVPMFGSAPLASIYAVRVLNPAGSGQESWILEGMDRVLQLRANYDAGQPETQNADGSYNALNIRVANMSLGGSTLFPGRDIEDLVTQTFLDHDIVLVVAAGNDGPGGATIASPGSGFGSLTVGAANEPVHERILRDIQFGVGIGPLYRPFSGIQMAYFSSRGPNADGRPDPDVVANGFACFGAGDGATNSVEIGSGTSFASPTVAGIAAVLRQAVPNATAQQVRNALIMSANPALVTDGSGAQDRGAGFVDATAAKAMLDALTAPDTPGAVGGTNKNVHVNLIQGSGIHTVTGNLSQSFSGVLPGQRFEMFYDVSPNTSAVVVTLSGVTPAAAASQNQLFGDDVLFSVHSSKTSAIGSSGDYKVQAFTLGGTWVIPNPDHGIMRITASGDWTNASPIGGTITISSVTDPEPGQTTKIRLQDGTQSVVPFTVSAGTSELAVSADWAGDWANYPANDIDVVLVAPNGSLNFAAATLNNPERAVIANPAAGQWYAVVQGFNISTKNGDTVTLRIAADGTVIK